MSTAVAVAEGLELCRNGHPRSEENTLRLPGGDRQCRICGRESKRRGRLGIRPPSFSERFWRLVGPASENGCRLWLGTIIPSRPPSAGRPGTYGGYGVLKIGQRQVRAHVMAWRLAYHGPVHPDRAVFRHSCDNPPCVEPSHIYPGTHAENTADRTARRRYRGARR